MGACDGQQGCVCCPLGREPTSRHRGSATEPAGPAWWSVSGTDRPVRGQRPTRSPGSLRGLPAPPGPQMLTLCGWVSLVARTLLGWLAVGPGWSKAPALSRQTRGKGTPNRNQWKLPTREKGWRAAHPSPTPFPVSPSSPESSAPIWVGGMFKHPCHWEASGVRF